MAPLPPLLQRRFLCSARHHRKQYSIKQVTKTNFSEVLEEIKSLIFDSDFIAVSLRKTGGYSSPWQRILPIDTAETAYHKGKYAAERFQVLQFAVCPFSLKASKLIAHPYNFHLFPRNELKTGMPSYSFMCQSSYLMSMAQEGFDFNACIYDGISYLSREQESAAKDQTGSHLRGTSPVQLPSSLSVADSVFSGRVKSRVKSWISACKLSKKTDDTLLGYLGKLVSGGELYGSRPSFSIDVCSERQVQLVLETLRDFADIVPLLIPDKGGGIRAVQAVLTSSKEDKDIFEKELQNNEEEHNKSIRGFREVIDLISTSQKPVVAHNSLHEFTFIYSKFLAPLPSTFDEFRSSLHLVFSYIVDINHLVKEISPFKKVNNLSAAINYLKRRVLVPLDLDIPNKAEANEAKIHGQNVLKITQLFAKLCTIRKLIPDNVQASESQLHSLLQQFANVFDPCSTNSQDPIDQDVAVWRGDTRKCSSGNLVFLWGFRGGMSGAKLKSLLCRSHEVFSGGFDVRLVDRSCAIIVFWIPGKSESFLEAMDSGGMCCELLKEMISEGLRAASYDAYRTACSLGLWEVNLADSLEKVLERSDCLSKAHSEYPPSPIYWNNDEMICLDDL